MDSFPKLRGVQPSLIDCGGLPYIMLRDPLSLGESTISVPQALGLLLDLCDGTRNRVTLKTSFELRTGIPISSGVVDQVINGLDEALLLENERFRLAYGAALEEYRATPRLPLLAHEAYPSDPNELREMLAEYVCAVSKEDSEIEPIANVKGMISPHIDFQRGGESYARLWKAAANSIRDIDLAIIIGTDHLGGRSLFNLTKQDYSTPLGLMPIAHEAVDDLAAAVGVKIAFADELHHRSEHSIELALVWLQYFLGEKKCELLPILCGGADNLLLGQEDVDHDEEINGVINVLRAISQSRRTVVIAAADLAHMGPAFGDQFPIDALGKAKIGAADNELFKAICSSDASGFLRLIRDEEDKRRICGLGPIYLALRVLGDARGVLCDYAQCPADMVNESLVSICGVVLE